MTATLRCAPCDVQWTTPREGSLRVTCCWVCGREVRLRPSMATPGPSDEVFPPRALGRGCPDGALTGAVDDWEAA